ncbi:MAG: hypothetical protein GC191_01955 [Azospirillum sp.]|nr:hypothetical protein [Azospirillum sp.]
MDQKDIFDAGYRAYEDGNAERDFNPGSVTWTEGDGPLAATWRAGWRRAREDSVLLRYGAKRARRGQPNRPTGDLRA